MPAERLMAAKLVFAPAMTLIRSHWPVHGIWQFNMTENAPQPGKTGENVLITRAEFDPVQTVLPPGGGVFVTALQQGDPFHLAIDVTIKRVPDFDLSQMLSILFAGNAITSINEGNE